VTATSRRRALVLALGGLLAAATPYSSRSAGLYAPPPHARGDWRRLLPVERPPDAAERARLRHIGGVDWDKLRAAWEYNAAAPGPTGLLVVRHGWVVGEWYRDADVETPFNIYSSSKAYVSVAFGLLLAEAAAGKASAGLTLDSRVYTERWLPEGMPPSDPRKAEITLRQLLQMTSGIPSHNDTGEPPAGVGPYEFALGKDPAWKTAKLAAAPGTAWSYSNPGVSHLILIHHRASGQDLRDYLRGRLFEPIGMTHFDWLAQGGEGHIGPHRQGYSGLLTTARDHARFLYLALHRGRWGTRQVVPADYYGWGLGPTPVKPDYGALWWRNRVPGTPSDTFQTGGARNNHGWVMPGLDLIVVRLGTGEKYPESFSTELLRLVQAALVDRSE
jgi:CubicO group peptidase (beta-lactamase class C family)